jgi:protein-S-isoprenylcysteine O-methyltransferase Ste14
MSPTVALLRALSLLALASPMFMPRRRPASENRRAPDKTAHTRLAVFANFSTFGLFLTCVIPSFVWRAFEEERVLVSVFGEPYVSYRRQTKMFVPYVL